MYNFTIIIPHKNIPDLLDRCLSSIPNREDLQIIIVDDNSDPGKVDFDNFPGKNRKNVEIIFTKENKGAGYARNVGLKNALGKWLLFADADDFFNYCINDFFNEYVEADCDIVFCNASCVDSDTYMQMRKVHHLNQYMDLWKSNPQKAELYLRYMFGEPWCKMVRREIVMSNGIVFDETRVHNDSKFSYLVGFYSQSILVDNRCVYTYTVRVNSISYQPKQEWKFAIRIDVFGKKELFFREKKVPISDDRYLKALYSYLRIRNLDGFKKAYAKLLCMGFTRFDLNKRFAYCLAKNSMLSSLYCICFAPNLMIKFFSLIYFFIVSIPHTVKYHILGFEEIK